MVQNPERYGSQIIRLSRYMMLKSGYYKRLVDYFVNMAVINWTVDLEPKTIKAYNPDEKMSKQIRTNYYKYVAQVNKFKLDSRITDIVRRLFVEDACFVPRSIIKNIKLVPQRGWKRLCFIAFSGVSSSPAS